MTRISRYRCGDNEVSRWKLKTRRQRTNRSPEYKYVDGDLTPSRLTIRSFVSYPPSICFFSPKERSQIMFQSDRFIEDCRASLREQNPHAAVREIVARAVSEPGQILKSLGEPKLSGIQTIYRSDSLTILNVLWGPRMAVYPPDHRMRAVIGIHSGREDNSIDRRSEHGLVAHGAKMLDLKDTLPLGEAVIHAVTNPLDRITAAIHVYGGDFFAVPRSEWDPQTLQERPFDIEHARAVFEEANNRLRSSSAF